MSGDTAAAAAARQAALDALKLASIELPHLAGLARLVEVYADARVPTAGITASGKLLVSPDWFCALPVADRAFVAAHELLHLAFQSHERGLGSDAMHFNVAHDFIINDVLVEALGRPVPAGGLKWPGARFLSAERILTEIRRMGTAPGPVWQIQLGPATSLGKALAKAGLATPIEIGVTGDLISEEQERKLFPGVDPAQARTRIRIAAAKAVSLELLKEGMDRLAMPPGTQPGESTLMIEALRSFYQPPWELGLQRWMESVAPGERSYARPSRRASAQSDAVVAGRKREGWTLHIVLDTSGSMTEEFPRILGRIAAFCEAANVSQVHLLQCDAGIAADEWVEPGQLEQFAISGLGGSDLSPAMLRLAEDPEVEAAIVITDGAIAYPDSAVPYQVLWVVTDDADNFRPEYGQVIGIEQNK